MDLEQPAPTANAGQPVWDKVIEDMRERDQVGRKRYGVPLQTFNGRDALIDAYAEALDLCVYLKQAIEERRIQEEEAKHPKLPLTAEDDKAKQFVGITGKPWRPGDRHA